MQNIKKPTNGDEMNKQELESHLIFALKRLEESSEQIIKTRGYTNEVEKVKVLEELIKEQLSYENTRNSTSSSR